MRFPPKSPAPPNHTGRILPAAFFAVLFFLCSADQFFTTRFLGFNFRWGQLLLLGWVFFSAARIQNPGDFFSARLKPFLLSWAPFGAAYAIAAALSPTPSLSLVKLLWGCVNISLAFALFALASNRPSLEKGIRIGILAIALVLWLDSILIYWFHCFPSIPYLYPSAPLTLHWFNFSILTGFAQPDESFRVDQMVRPNAFYYEPSYAGCALSFSTLLLIAFSDKTKSKIEIWASALIVSAIVLTTSRSGLLGITLGLGSLILYSFFKKDIKEKIPYLLKIGVLSISLIILFSAFSPLGRKYLGTLFGYKGKETIQRMSNPEKSEGGRIRDLDQGLNQWNDHFWLGRGVLADSNGGAIVPTAPNTWMEIGLESGTIGLFTFIFAVGSSMFRAFRQSPASAFTKGAVAAAWFVHFGVNLNFCQTFPRLDFWLLFYFSLFLLSKGPEKDSASSGF